MKKNESEVLGSEFNSWSDKELKNMFVLMGSIKVKALDDKALAMYGNLIYRGLDPLNLTLVEDDNDAIEAHVDEKQGTVTLSIPEELIV